MQIYNSTNIIIIICISTLVQVTALTKLTLFFGSTHVTHSMVCIEKKYMNLSHCTGLAQLSYITICIMYILLRSPSFPLQVATKQKRSCNYNNIRRNFAGIIFFDTDSSSLVCLGKQAFKFKTVVSMLNLSYERALIQLYLVTIKFKLHMSYGMKCKQLLVCIKYYYNEKHHCRIFLKNTQPSIATMTANIQRVNSGYETNWGIDFCIFAK